MDGVVCMMCAFGSGGWLGPIFVLSHRCSATAMGHSILDDQSLVGLAVVERGLERTEVQAHRQTRNSGRRVCSDLSVGGRFRSFFLQVESEFDRRRQTCFSQYIFLN